MRIWKVIVALLVISTTGLRAQVNYVPNAGFERYTKCPYDGDQIMLASGWTSLDTVTRIMGDYGNPLCSADYCNECGTGLYSSIPVSAFAYQYARSGKGMASVYMYTPDSNASNHYLRDYIQHRLTKTLAAGQSYCVSFYVNLEEVSANAIKEISAYLDNGSIDSTTSCGLPQMQYTPQVTNTGGIITDTAGWTKIEGAFIATGNEQFITIGNFRDRTHTTHVAIPPNRFTAARLITYYLVDDVSVIESDLMADAGPDKHVGPGDSVYIGRPDEVGPECSWSVLGNPAIIGTGIGIWVKPAVTTSYVVSQTLCGVTKMDTVQVQVWAAGVGNNNGRHRQDYTLAPNPNNGAFEISQSFASAETVNAEVYNVVGQRMYSTTAHFKDGKALLDVRSQVLPGIYYLLLKDATGNVYTMRFVKQ